MQKKAMDKPDFVGEKAEPCPLCGNETVGRRQRNSGKLYFGCKNFAGGCRFNGRRDLPDKPGTQI